MWASGKDRRGPGRAGGVRDGSAVGMKGGRGQLLLAVH